MIIVRVELHSAITGKVTEIARMGIANIGGDRKRGDYRVETYRGRSAGELSKRPLFGASGEPLIDAAGLQRVDKVPPRAWFDRIVRAVEVGAFERMSVEQVVDHILIRPAGSAET